MAKNSSRVIHYLKAHIPGAPLTNFNDRGVRQGGPTEVHILYPKKSQLQNLSTQKNHYFLKHTQKNPLVLFSQPKKIPLFFFATQKNHGIFYRPKKSLLPKFQTQKNHSDLPVINPLSQEEGGGCCNPPFRIFPCAIFVFLLRLPYGPFTHPSSRYPYIYEKKNPKIFAMKKVGGWGRCNKPPPPPPPEREGVAAIINKFL